MSGVVFAVNRYECFMENKNMIRTLSLSKILLVLIKTWRRLCINSNSAGNYMFKVNNRNTKARCEICSKLTIKTPCSSVSIVNF